MELLRRLRERDAQGRPIAVGVVGCGQMGSGLVHVLEKAPGMRASAVADVEPSRALAAFAELGLDRSAVRVTNRRAEAEDALRAGLRLVTEDATLLAELEGLEAVVEATGLTDVGARVAWGCILNRKHVIMLNVETDVAVGYILQRQARNAGCVYTVASGDEPGVCMGLYELACSLGFEVVCLGKGKNNRIDFDATPDNCREEALAKGMNPKMLAAFRDGTKTMTEMAAVSNATGLLPDRRGMHGLKVDVPDLAKVYVPRSDGGVFARRGVVDYSIGKVAPGVFAVVTSDDAHVRRDMTFVGMGPGPYFTLYRPFHLCNMETPYSVARAVLCGERTLVAAGMYSEVVTIAKRDLKAGETVGDIGSADIYGTICTYEEAKAGRCVPVGLAAHGKVLRDTRKGELLTQESFAPDTSSFVWKLRQMQDELLASEARAR